MCFLGFGCSSWFSFQLCAADRALRGAIVGWILLMAGGAVPHPFQKAADAKGCEGREFYSHLGGDVLYRVVISDDLRVATCCFEF
jgi:hypothetical protein